MPDTIATKLIGFFSTLQPPRNLPKGIEVLFPYKKREVRDVVKEFYNKFYSDNIPRRFLIGINPGRFGAGITGINFTAPRQLKNNCDIDHNLGDSSELSGEFIYEVIERYGGPAEFFSSHFISSVSALGFVKNDVNMNYYDDKQLQHAIVPFAVKNIKKQLSFGFKTDHCICIGGEKNFKFLSSLNEKHQFFEKIIPLPHPRFILQYRRKQKEDYVKMYLEALD